MAKKDGGPIDLESLRDLLWEIDNQVVTHGIGYREVITRTERVVSEVIAELAARRARDKWAGELPPLPEPEYGDTDCHSGYSVQQVHDYARAAIAARTCPLPAHWRMAIEEWEGRMLPSPRKLKEICDLIEQRARQMAKAGGDRG